MAQRKTPLGHFGFIVSHPQLLGYLLTSIGVNGLISDSQVYFFGFIHRGKCIPGISKTSIFWANAWPRYFMKKYYLLFIMAFTAAIAANGQSPLDDRISVYVKQQPLKEVLYSMIDQGARLSFNNNVLPSGKLITLQATEERVGKILPLLLDGTDLVYQIVGSQIVIVRNATLPPSKQKFTLNGFVTDAETGEHIINATIFDGKRGAGTYTNEFGHYSLTIKEGPITLIVSSLGYQSDTINLELNSNFNLGFKLKPLVLAEVVVAYYSDSSLLKTSFGGFELNLEQAEMLPSLGGETDVLRVGYTLPGIQTGADGFGGISVRGGDIDQNQFLLDGVPIYNASHGLGIFSIYNSAAVRNAKILKGNFPAQYGGRISSIWDIQTKEGNMKEVQGELEFGPGSVQLTLEGPLSKGQGSWFVSGRRSLFDLYSDFISRKLRYGDGISGRLNYIFQDLNAKANYKISKNDRLYLSIYRGNDNFLDKTRQEFAYSEDSTIFVFSEEKIVKWGNNLASLRWNHLISDKLFANITTTFSNYYYDADNLVDIDLLDNNGSIERNIFFQKYKSSISDYAIKSDFDYSAFRQHRFRFGTSFTKHQFQPGVITYDRLTVLDQETRDTIGAYLKTPLVSNEIEVYAQDEVSFGNGLSANIGLRGTALVVNGKTLHALQPRLMFQLNKNRRVSYSLAASRNAQFLHLLSPTNIGLPKDLWVSATQAAPPQSAWQFALGTHLKPLPWVSLDIEAYYKYLDKLIYFQGQTLESINATNWQDEIVTGKGWAYGAEMLLKVERGRIGGWISYTYGRSTRQFKSDRAVQVNNGKEFPIRLDRRHNFNLQMLYKINKNWDFSMGFVLASGSAFTFPSQLYEIKQSEGNAPTEIIQTFTVITDLNKYRLPTYNRFDFAFNYKFLVRNVKHSLKLGVYNTYLYKNPTYFTLRDRVDDNGILQRQTIQVSMLPFFPTLRYVMEIK